MKKIIYILLFIFTGFAGFSQITVNTNFKPNISAPIDNRMVLTNLSDTTTIAFYYEGQLIYITSTNKFYYYETSWKELETQITINDSTTVAQGWGVSIVESPNNTFTVKADTSQLATQYDLTQIVSSDTQDLSIDSLNRVFTISLDDGGSVKWEDKNATINYDDIGVDTLAIKTTANAFEENPMIFRYGINADFTQISSDIVSIDVDTTQIATQTDIDSVYIHLDSKENQITLDSVGRVFTLTYRDTDVSWLDQIGAGSSSIDSITLGSGYGIYAFEADENTWQVEIDSSQTATQYDLTLKQNRLIEGFGVEIATDTINADSIILATRYDLDKLITPVYADKGALYYNNPDSTYVHLIIGDSKSEPTYGIKQLKDRIIEDRGGDMGPGYGCFSQTPPAYMTYTNSGGTIMMSDSQGIVHKAYKLGLNNYYTLKSNSTDKKSRFSKITYWINEVKTGTLVVYLDNVAYDTITTDGSGVKEVIYNFTDSLHELKFKCTADTILLLDYIVEKTGNTAVWSIHRPGGSTREFDKYIDESWDVFQKYNPSTVTIRLGTNDRIGYEPDSLYIYYDSLIVNLKRKFPNVTLQLCSIEPTLVNSSYATITEYNNIVYRLAKEYVIAVVDVYSTFYDWQRMTNLGLTSNTSHENEKAGELIGALYYKTLKSDNSNTVSQYDLSLKQDLTTGAVEGNGAANRTAIWMEPDSLSSNANLLNYNADGKPGYFATGNNDIVSAFGYNAGTTNPFFSFNDISGYLYQSWFGKYNSGWKQTLGGVSPGQFSYHNNKFDFSIAADAGLGGALSFGNILEITPTGTVFTQRSGTALTGAAFDSNGKLVAMDYFPIGNTGTGTVGFIPKYATTTTLNISGIYQHTDGKIGVNTTAPVSAFDIRGLSAVNGLSIGEPTRIKQLYASVVSNNDILTILSNGSTDYYYGQINMDVGWNAGNVENALKLRAKYNDRPTAEFYGEVSLDKVNVGTSDTLLIREGNVIKKRLLSSLPSVIDSTIVQNSYGTIITETPANTFNIKVDSSKFATTYDLTQNDNQTLASDSTSTTIGITASNSNSRVHYTVDRSATNEVQTLTYTPSTRLLDISLSATDATLPLFSTTGTDAGLVSGGSGISTKFLRGDNTWQTISSGVTGSGKAKWLTYWDTDNTIDSTIIYQRTTQAAATAFTFGSLSTAGLEFGTNVGNSYLFKTPSLSASYNSGLAIHGTYAGNISNVKLTAYGVRQANYMSYLTLRVTDGTSEVDGLVIDQLGGIKFPEYAGLGTRIPCIINSNGGVSMPNLYWNIDNNRLGIDVAVPTQALHVNGTGRFNTLGTGAVKLVSANADGTLSIATTALYDPNTTNEGILSTTQVSGQAYLKSNTSGSPDIKFTGANGINVTGDVNGSQITISGGGSVSPSVALAYLETEQTISPSDSVNFQVVSIYNGDITIPNGKDYFLIGADGFYELNFSCNIWRNTGSNTVGKFIVYNDNINLYSNVELDLNDSEKKWASRSAIIECEAGDKIWIKCEPTADVKIDQGVISLKKL